MFEAQRLGNVIPFVPRCLHEDVTLSGLLIPAGTNIVPMLSAIHEDPRRFPDPLVFKPERFLDDAGRLLPKVEGFLPYSIGTVLGINKYKSINLASIK